MHACRISARLLAAAVLACTAWITAAVAQQPGPAVYSRDEYYALFPVQQAVDAAFADTVAGPAVPLSVDQVRPVRIVIVYPALQISDYWRRSVTALERRLHEIGVAFDIETHFTRPSDQIAVQGLTIGDALYSPPDYLIFTLDANRHRGMIERIMVGGTTKVILQNITSPLRNLGGRQPFLYVGFDHRLGAQMLADRFMEAFPQGGRYAVFYGARGFISAQRGAPFVAAMDARDGMTRVASYYVGFNRAQARAAALDLLDRWPDVQFIYACSTDIAHGIVDALKERNRLGSVMVNGWGGGSSELAAIAAGELAFTAMRMNDDNGVAIAEAIRMDVEGMPRAQMPLIYSGAFAMVDQDTDEETLAALVDYAFRYSD